MTHPHPEGSFTEPFPAPPCTGLWGKDNESDGPVVKAIKREGRTPAQGVTGEPLTGLGVDAFCLALPLTSIHLSQSEG